MTEKKFVDGLIAKAPHERAPEFVKATLAIRVEEFVAWLGQQQHNGWLNIDIKESRGGKWYAEVNSWQKLGLTERPSALKEESPLDDDMNIPF